MEFLKRILDYINEDSAKDMVSNINDELLKIQDSGLINDEERDALRHYFGIQSLADEYGDTVAWLSGLIHEGTDLIIPGEAGIQSQVDRANNNIALAHREEGIFLKLEDLNSYDKLRDLLNVLEIPPPYRFDSQTAPPSKEKKPHKPQTYNMGYNPKLADIE